MRTEPDNCTPRLLPPARSGEGQYCAILASLQAVRPRCAAGAAPGPRLRVPHAPNTPETTRKTVTTNHKPRLDQFRRFRDDPDMETYRGAEGPPDPDMSPCRGGGAGVGAPGGGLLAGGEGCG